MLVSIVTASYNNATTLSETIDSVLCQSIQNWEWIIVVNGSNDNTSEVLKTLKDDTRIKILELEKNFGVSAARNIGLANASGEFLCFLDGDDILPKRSLEARLEKFAEDESLEFVDGRVISFKGEIDNVIEVYTPDFLGNPFQELLSLSGRVFKGNTWMIRKVVGKSYRFQEGLTHGEELLFYASICNSGNYSYTTDPILYYRRHGSSAMANVPKLANGYLQIAQSLKNMETISPENLKCYLKKASSIVFKSLLKDKKPILAVIKSMQIRWA